MILNLPLKKKSFWGLNPPVKRHQRSRFFCVKRTFPFDILSTFSFFYLSWSMSAAWYVILSSTTYKTPPQPDWKHNSLLWSVMNLCSSSVIKYSWFKTHFIPTQITHVKEIGGFIRFLLFSCTASLLHASLHNLLPVTATDLEPDTRRGGGGRVGPEHLYRFTVKSLVL